MARRWTAFAADGGLCGNLACMDERELLLKILIKLGLKDMFRLTSVCKSWYDLVFSPRFGQLYTIKQQPWAVVTIRAAVEQQNTRNIVWRPLDVSPRLDWTFPSLSGLCSSGGLVCGVLEGSSQLLIMNPITGERTQLPPLEAVQYNDLRGVFMETRPDASGYTVMVLARSEPAYSSFHYRSVTRSWHAADVVSTGEDTSWAERVIPVLPSTGSGFCCTIVDDDRGVDVVQNIQAEFDAWSFRTDWSNRCVPEFVSAFHCKLGHCFASLLLESEDTNTVTGAAIWRRVKGGDGKSHSEFELVSRYMNTDSGNPVDVDLAELTYAARLVGELVIICVNYFSSDQRGAVWSPVAYDLAHDAWYSFGAGGAAAAAAGGAEVADIQHNYSFLPSLLARP